MFCHEEIEEMYDISHAMSYDELQECPLCNSSIYLNEPVTCVKAHDTYVLCHILCLGDLRSDEEK